MSLSLRLSRTTLAPGAEVTGVASWKRGADPVDLEVRLFWYTEGKGDRDVGIADSTRWSVTGSGERDFALRLPAGPITFSGRLISLIWAVELVEPASGESARAELVVSHTGEEIRIDAGPEDGAAAAVDPIRPA